jgi:phosphopantothenate synthetase
MLVGVFTAEHISIAALVLSENTVVSLNNSIVSCSSNEELTAILKADLQSFLRLVFYREFKDIRSVTGM